MLGTTEQSLKRIFTDAALADAAGDKSPPANTGSAVIERVKKIRDFAFVHFSDRQHALTAMNRLNGLSYNTLQSSVHLLPVTRLQLQFHFDSSVVRRTAALRPKQAVREAAQCAPPRPCTPHAAAQLQPIHALRLRRPARLAP